MKKLLILTVCLILTVTAIAQTQAQKNCYNAASQFITDTYATILSEELLDSDCVLMTAAMPLGYTDYLIKLDLKNLIESYSGIRMYRAWAYDDELDVIYCTIAIDEAEEMLCIYSATYNTISFYFAWK